MADSSDSQEGPMKDIPWYPQGLCCYVLVTVSQYPGRIWCQTEVPVSYLTILVLTINDDGSEWLTWHLHFFLKSHSLRSNIPKYIQRCGGKDFQALDENSGGGGRGYGRIWPRSTESGLLFYADDVLLALTQSDCLQWEFDIQTGIFERVDLKNNLHKTVGIVLQPCHIVGGHSDTN